jgi:hypothetical protein
VSPRIKSESPPRSTPPKKPSALHPKAVFSVLLLVGLALSAHFAWQHSKAQLAQDPHFALTLDKIRVTPTPPWIRSDIKSQALRDANLIGMMSLLDEDDSLPLKIKQAFELHPWVASVSRITRRLPGSLDVELVYRKPVAAVESSDAGSVALIPVDADAIRLPEADLTEAERRHLPRISGITGRPLIGDHWNDPRVLGGAKLAAQLSDVWQKLRLVEIIANIQPVTRDERQLYRYELVTTGGTRILWGTTPGDESATGESPFNLKRQRLLDYAEKQGKLESIEGPAMLDVRSNLVVTPRTAKRKAEVRKSDDTQTR